MCTQSIMDIGLFLSLRCLATAMSISSKKTNMSSILALKKTLFATLSKSEEIWST